MHNKIKKSSAEVLIIMFVIGKAEVPQHTALTDCDKITTSDSSSFDSMCLLSGITFNRAELILGGFIPRRLDFILRTIDKRVEPPIHDAR